MAVVGVSGCRRLGRRFAPVVAAVCRSVVLAGRGVAVGCASGADRFARAAAPSAVVFSVASGRFGSGRAAFARRSAALVQFVAAGGPGSGFVGFVSSPCPAGVAPGRVWRSGSPPSGSWSSLALAAGLGLPVVVFWCGGGAPVLPSSWGRWVAAAAAGPWAGGWRLVV